MFRISGQCLTNTILELYYTISQIRFISNYDYTGLYYAIGSFVPYFHRGSRGTLAQAMAILAGGGGVPAPVAPTPAAPAAAKAAPLAS